MGRREEWKVGGFLFGSEEDAELARTEQEKVAYLEKRMQYDHPESVLTIYNKAIDNQVFQTPVGYQYLQQVLAFLRESGLEEQAHSIPLFHVYGRNAQEKPRAMAVKRVQPSQYSKLRSSLRKSVILNIFLILLVIVMFVITLTGSNPTILDYEKKLQDRYAGWEQELTEREAAVREKERKLSIEDTGDGENGTLEDIGG